LALVGLEFLCLVLATKALLHQSLAVQAHHHLPHRE